MRTFQQKKMWECVGVRRSALKDSRVRLECALLTHCYALQTHFSTARGVNTFPDNGLKPPFSVLLWPLEGQNLANIAKNASILNTRPISIHTKFELDCMNAFSNNGRKPPFSVILWPLDGLNLANVAKQQINSEHSPNNCTHQV